MCGRLRMGSNYPTRNLKSRSSLTHIFVDAMSTSRAELFSAFVELVRPMNTTETPATVETKTIDFGSGRYSKLALEAFKDAKRLFKIDDEHAEKIGKQIASDFGAAMRQDGIDPKGTISRKLAKDGMVTLREASKVKTRETPALSLMRAMSYMNEASDFGLNSGVTVWALNDVLQECLDTFQP